MSTSTENEKAAQWFYLKEDQTVGPVATEELRSLFKTGGIKDSTFVFREGMADWLEFWAVAELQNPPGAREVMPASKMRSPRFGRLVWFSAAACVLACALWLIGLRRAKTDRASTDSPTSFGATSNVELTRIVAAASNEPPSKSRLAAPLPSARSLARISSSLEKLGLVSQTVGDTVVFLPKHGMHLPIVMLRHEGDLVSEIHAMADLDEIIEKATKKQGHIAKDDMSMLLAGYGVARKTLATSLLEITGHPDAYNIFTNLAHSPLASDAPLTVSGDNIAQRTVILGSWKVKITARLFTTAYVAEAIGVGESINAGAPAAPANGDLHSKSESSSAARTSWKIRGLFGHELGGTADLSKMRPFVSDLGQEAFGFQPASGEGFPAAISSDMSTVSYSVEVEPGTTRIRQISFQWSLQSRTDNPSFRAAGSRVLEEVMRKVRAEHGEFNTTFSHRGRTLNALPESTCVFFDWIEAKDLRRRFIGVMDCVEPGLGGTCSRTISVHCSEGPALDQTR